MKYNYKYKRDLIVRSFSGEARFKAEERKYLRFSIRCPSCGKKNRFKVTYAAMYNDRPNGRPFWLVDCKNRECDFDFVELAYKELLDYLEKLKVKQPLIAKKLEKVCGKLDPPKPIDPDYWKS